MSPNADRGRCCPGGSWSSMKNVHGGAGNESRSNCAQVDPRRWSPDNNVSARFRVFKRFPQRGSSHSGNEAS
eukprot:6646155-Pyramimonas_sp.AAC.1